MGLTNDTCGAGIGRLSDRAARRTAQVPRRDLSYRKPAVCRLFWISWAVAATLLVYEVSGGGGGIFATPSGQMALAEPAMPSGEITSTLAVSGPESP